MTDTHTLPWRIPSFDLYLIGQGGHHDLYRILGAHPELYRDTPGYRFAVWAPNAREVAVIGDFNAWDTLANPLFSSDSGIWSGFVPGVVKGQHYKFALTTQDGRTLIKADPMALATEMRPGNAARAWDLDNYQWNDREWIKRRSASGPPLDEAISIYEVHAGSWRWKGEAYGSFLSYRDMAEELVAYVKELGFTHIEFLPLAEHPLDDSWGYQVGHFFSPTSRFGTPEDLKYLVDRCHQAGIGVILDWVPAHFPKDAWGLGRFDGTALYEHADPRQGEHPDWGTLVFNYARTEVRNFLFSNALYWLKEFHFDGLRIDAVASMLYLDYSRKEGEWVPNRFGGKENIEAIEFLRDLNVAVHQEFPGAAMIAEESTSWTGVSRPTYTGGLGFTFKWNMGWMHDTLGYFREDPVNRSWHHNRLTFSMLYAFHENFVLPLSHDEITHGKGSLVNKMPGDSWQKFANLRAMLAYMWAHPGKKLLFMGSEFAQWKEWNAREPLDWALTGFPSHRGVMSLLADLNRLLVSEPAMSARDNDWSGFEWVGLSDYQASVFSFLRKAPDGSQLLWVFNFTPVVRTGYCIGCRAPGRWREVFNSDSAHYGGSDTGNAGAVMARVSEMGGWPYYLELTLPPLAAMAFQPEE